MLSNSGKHGTKLATIEKIAAQAKLKPSYLVLMGMSGVLAAVAFLAHSVPMLVGAMVVSPIFPPLALVSFASISGLFSWAARGFGAAFVGMLVATICATLTAWALDVTGVLSAESSMVSSQLLKERLTIGWFSPVAAVAAGIAGAIAVSQDKYDTLIGVVAALALVPAAAAAGIALLTQDFAHASDGLLLLGVNALCTVAAGAVTFLIIRPEDEAK
jgi:uncharacterized hydrophobic protein (TIGR00271 family)